MQQNADAARKYYGALHGGNNMEKRKAMAYFLTLLGGDEEFYL